MFSEIPDQFYPFMDSRTALPFPLPVPPSLPLYVSPPCFSGLDPLPCHQPFQSHLPNQFHRQSLAVEDEEQEEEREVNRSIDLQGLKPTHQRIDPWTEEEIIALWRIRSSIDTGFANFVWEDVSRKLAEVGFIRSAEKCKEKFEEVSKYYNNSSNNNNYRPFNELQAVYEGVNLNHPAEKGVINDGGSKMKLDMEEDSGNGTLLNSPLDNKDVTKTPKIKKRKKYHKLKLLKSFCEETVKKIMVQQEEMQYKLLQELGRRDEERVAREEAWRKQEIARMDREIETRAREQTLACDRDTTIIEFLKKCTSNLSQNQGLCLKSEDFLKTLNDPITLTSPSLIPTSLITKTKPDVPTSSTIALAPQKADSTPTLSNSEVPTSPTSFQAPQNPNFLAIQDNIVVPTSPTTLPAPQSPNETSSDREDHGKRWPRNEVESLINLRCNNLYSSFEDKEGTKVRLWDRISQGMFELGYKRSAKRCKEKWENINKYFRKTKDVHKKRSANSKTCPYFHQLSSLYNQGTLVLPSE